MRDDWEEVVNRERRGHLADSGESLVNINEANGSIFCHKNIHKCRPT